MIETMTSDGMLARLEALTARLEAQEARIAGLEAENARLSAALSTPTVAPPAAPVTTSRRGMLRHVVGASAAAALLLVAKEAATAEATANVSLNGPSTTQYGLAASVGASGSVVLPALGSTTHSVIGSEVTSFESSFYTPTMGSGVLGLRAVTNAAGVQGINATGPGVFGRSASNAGVQGVSTDNAGVLAQGPIGLFATGTGLAGVFGGSNAGGFGFWGNSVTNAGVYGTSTAGPGVRAESTHQYGLYAKGPTYAGVFEGNVFVTGRVVALGGVGASAATATTRTLAEDVGEATLTNGKATVALAQDFADAANGDYWVFLTELADLGGLYVVRKGPKEFEVRSRGGAGQVAQTGRFDYRVVATTVGANNPRQAPLAPPDLTTIKPAPPLPEPPKAPEPPERRR